MARFLSLNFIKGEKPEHEHLEGGGLMKLGYGLMVSVLFILLYLIFTNEETEGFVHAGYLSVSLMVGLGALIVYTIALFIPRISIFSRVPGTFFSDRMYLPFLNDYIVPKIGFFIAISYRSSETVALMASSIRG
jgi:NADH-quinone oxidoreductase subunit L